MKKFLIFASAIAALACAACNTVEGVGKDVKAAGAVVEDAAQDTKP
jgi:predicted small secreted protein